MRFLKLQQVQYSGISDPIHWLYVYDILPDDSKKATAIRRKTPRFYYNTIMRTLYRWSHDRILLAAYHTRSHRKRSRKLMTVCADLTNLDPSLGTDFEGLAIVCRSWFLTPSPMLSDVTLVRSMVTSYTKHQVIFIHCLLRGHWDVENGSHRIHQPSDTQRTSVHLNHNWLLIQISKSHPPERSKNI